MPKFQVQGSAGFYSSIASRHDSQSRERPHGQKQSKAITDHNKPGLVATLPDEGPDIPLLDLHTRASSQSSFPIVRQNRPDFKSKIYTLAPVSEAEYKNQKRIIP